MSDEQALALFRAVGAAAKAERKARIAVHTAVTGMTPPEEREAIQRAYRDAMEAVTDARVALVDAAMEAP